ncbi:MAG: SIR2 family protein [Nitrosopumilus sp.]|nr:SIR2 family protein [Nitrosopumilus sp.]NRA05302.1 SIR2 family protein [Nitrosopumilus sp.]
MIPEPLLKAIQAKRCLLFIGAGFSKNAQMPNGLTMPSWKELAIELSKDLREKSDEPLIAASNYAKEFDKNELIRKLSELLHVDIAKPGKVHDKLTTIIAFDTIVTTNFEFLLENAFSNKKPTHVIVGDEHIGKYSPSTHTNIIKIHGDFTHYNDIVITQEDYDNFLDEHPVLSTNLAAWFSTKIPLFVGYSLNDPHFQQLRHILQKQLGDFMNKGYIVLFDADEKTINEYEDDHLIVINLKTKDTTREKALLEFLCQIQDYVSVKDTDYSTLFVKDTLQGDVGDVDNDNFYNIHTGKVINAFSKFEWVLRDALRNYGVDDTEIKRSFSYLVKTAAQNGILDPHKVGELTRIRDTRNKIVHSKYIPTTTEVNYITKLIADIQKHISEIKQPHEQTTIRLFTNKTTYDEKTPIIITGNVSPRLSNVSISLMIMDPKKQIVAIFQEDVDTAGNFKVELMPGGPLWIHSGNYEILANYGNTKNKQRKKITFVKKNIPKTVSYEVQLDDGSYDVEYTINGGDLKNIQPDYNANSLIFNLSAFSEGELFITLPRTLIDAKKDSQDDEFFVLANREEVSFDERIFDDYRILSIEFPENTYQLEIIGTRVGGKTTPSSNIIKPLKGSGVPNDEGKYLDPQTLIIKKGQKVIFSNTDTAVHTFTAGTPDGGPSGEFDTNVLLPGNSFEYTPHKVGVIHYFCMVHPWKEGKIIVKD